MFSKIFSRLSLKTGNQPAAPKARKTDDVPQGEKPAAGQRKRNHGNQSHSKAKSVPVVADWDISQFVVEKAEGKTRFHDFDLPNELMHAIADLGFSYCSPIQAQSLPHTLRGGDVVGKAQTGTGKTAAFLITVIHDLLKNPVQHERYAGEARAIILAPTRELAIQIGQDAENLCKYCGLKVQTLVGGMDYQKQKNHLHSALVDIVVATPGRLIDFMESRDVYLDEVDCLVIDEADRMLDMGFIPQVKRIVRATPPKENRQTLLFSATFNQDVLNLASQWTCSPVHIEIQPERAATDNVQQLVYMISSDEKFTVLMNLLNQNDVQSMIVFANRRDICRDLFEKLQACGVSCGMLSGEVDQNKRVRTLEHFKSGQTRVLVATDVAGRGIHVDGISHVVNYTLPETPDDYVHRIGRTGRAGATGVSISFACEDDGFLLPEIERTLGKKLVCEIAPVELLKTLPAELVQRAEKAERDSRRERRSQSPGGNRGGGSHGSGGARRSSGNRPAGRR
ncbi:MAG TPA: ATP-dependent RNA helicase RhlB [Pseudomonadales bacterium]|nr:ATP-dependent RNA helicase RhlB [Pseudomonadales bacterium]